MDLNKNINNSEIQKLELVVRDLMEELKEVNKGNRDIIESINHLSAKVSSLEEKLENIEITAPTIDTQSIKENIEKGLIDLRQFMDFKLNRSRESNWRIFLQSDAKKWAVYLILGIVLLTYGYMLLDK